MINYLDLDVVGAFFNFAATICYIRVSPLAWPIGLIAIVADGVLFFQKGIYGDVGLNVIYFAMTFYGWYQWKYGGENKTELPITSLAWKDVVFLGVLTVVGITLVVFLLKTFTNSQIPYWDATTTVISLIAQWLICRKIIQCWHLWFIVDSLFVGMYLYKGIPMHAFLNIIYVIMAVVGYVNWNNFRVKCESSI